MNNTNTIIILFSIIAIVLLMGCTSQPSNNFVSNQTNESNKNVTQTTGINVSNKSTANTTASNASVTICDKQCFVNAANVCGNETIQLTESYGVVKYATSNCIFTKTVISLAQNESADIKRIIEGKNMTCLYNKGNFDQNWTSSLVLGIEGCRGGLKDAIEDLLVFS